MSKSSGGRFGKVTETLPPLLKVIREGAEPQRSEAFCKLRAQWAPLIGRLKRKMGRKSEDFDQNMDVVLLKACTLCNPDNLVFKWWRAIIVNAAINMYVNGTTLRTRERFTWEGILPDKESKIDPGAWTEAKWAPVDSGGLMGEVDRLSPEERRAIGKRMAPGSFKPGNADGSAMKRLRAWWEAEYNS